MEVVDEAVQAVPQSKAGRQTSAKNLDEHTGDRDDSDGNATSKTTTDENQEQQNTSRATVARLDTSELHESLSVIG